MAINPTFIPQLGDVPYAIDPELRDWLSDVKERLEVEAGIKGDPLDLKPTIRTLVESGLLEFRDGSRRFVYDPNKNNGPFFGTNIPTYGKPPDVENFEVTGGFNSIFVSWTPIFLSYGNYSHTEVWREVRSPVADPDPPDFATNAVLVARERGPVYVDVIEDAGEKSYWYWARHVSVHEEYGDFTTGNNGPPYTDFGTASYDPAYVAQILTGELDESHLVSDLNTRIDIIDVLGGPDGSGGIVDWATKVEGAIYDPSTGISAILSNHSTSIDTTIPGAISVQEQRVTALYSGSATDPVTGAPNALAGDIDSLELTVNNTSTGVTISSQRIDALFANSGTDPKDGGASAIVTAINTAETNATNVANGSAAGSMADLLSGDWATATGLNQWVASVGDYTSAVETLAEVVGTDDGEGMRAQYHVKTEVDVNGVVKVAGYGIWNDGATSEFIVSADKFALSLPTVDSGVAKYPFVIGTVNGSTAISMNAATFIQDLSVTNAAISTLAADKLFVASGTIAEALIGTAHITNAMVDALEANKIYADSGTLAAAFIGTADINTAMIEDAAINTLKLAGQAVTIPSSSYTSGSLTLTTSWQDVATISYTSTGNPTDIDFSSFFTVSSFTGDCQCRLLYEGSVVHTFTNMFINTAQATNAKGYGFAVRHTPTAGSRTYKVQAKKTSANPSAIEHRGLRSLEVKR